MKRANPNDLVTLKLTRLELDFIAQLVAIDEESTQRAIAIVVSGAQLRARRGLCLNIGSAIERALTVTERKTVTGAVAPADGDA